MTAALVYLCAHACYKGALFLIAGTLEHETGTREVPRTGRTSSHNAPNRLRGALAACSMAGLPLFLGFTGKELFYEALLNHGAPWSQALLAASASASALLGAAGLIAGIAPFAGPPGKAVAKHRVPVPLAIPPLILAAAGLVLGICPRHRCPNRSCRSERSNGNSGSASRALARFHMGTRAESADARHRRLSVSMAECVRPRIWPWDLGFERLYMSSVRALDAISAWSLPVLQGASLRSYVLALVTTAGILVTVVLVSHGLPSWPVVSGIKAPEAAAALMIVGGAISAVRAKSAIKAVLSLGITGYGVALTFLFFGAPDLAMTQFSVETLTAVIFVLVFYRFPSLGLLSHWRVRVGDALVAVLVRWIVLGRPVVRSGVDHPIAVWQVISRNPLCRSLTAVISST